MRALPAIVILSLAAPAAARSEVAERDLRQAIAFAERGMSALEKGNSARARESFARSLEKLPDLPEGHLGLGHIAMKERRFEDALAEYRRAEAGYRSMAAVRVELESERYAKSRDELQRLRGELAQLDHQSARNEMLGGEATGSGMGLTPGGVERGRTQLQNRIGQLEAMPSPTLDSAKEPPAEVYFFKGNALFDLKRTDEAIAAWETSASRNGKLPLVQNNLAVAYWTKGRLAEAHAAMERAEALGFKVNPNFRADLDRASAGKP